MGFLLLFLLLFLLSRIMIMSKNMVLAIAIIGTALMIGGCATSLKGDVYSRDEARTAQTVTMGTIQTLRPVQIEGTKTPIGAGAGAAVGGIAGSGVGDGRGRAVAAVIGAVAGGLLGAAAEEGLTRTQGVEITVKEDSGITRAYVQAMSEGEIFRVGDRVRIMTVNGTARVAR
jgi:outer membrane lipoprotein SlyB